MKKFLTPRYVAAILFAINILWTIIKSPVISIINTIAFGSRLSFRSFLPDLSFMEFIWIIAFAGLIAIMLLKLKKEFMVIPAALTLLITLARIIGEIVDLFDYFTIESLMYTLFFILGYILFALGIVAFAAVLFLGKNEKVNKFFYVPGALMILGSVLGFLPDIFEIFEWLFNGKFIAFFCYCVLYLIIFVSELAYSAGFIFCSRYVVSDDESIEGMMFWKKK